MSRKTIFSVIVVGAAASLGLYMSRGPWLAYREQRLKADQATKEMVKTEQERTDLLIEKAKDESPLGQEALARQRHWHKPDEVPLDSGQ
ncbi:MAG TPA: hypothetical protein VG820_00105 [Fimbriimonadaceae bacterium]|nr:hypothetical protein [Fimbriimonadaceae bacterium]